MTAVIIRLALRYGAGYLVARGWLGVDDGATLATDPDVQLLVGTGLAVAAEGWYYLANKFGWAT